LAFHHVPVLLREVLDGLAVRPGGAYADCTVGGGGHAREIAERLGPGGLLVGLDQDPNALAAASRHLAEFGDRVRLVRSNFERLGQVLRELGLTAADGILMDLGVSSHQLDEAERGFSYQHDAPLDMRMDPDRPLSARTLVNQYTESELARTILQYGEERWASRIAQFIVRERQRRPLETTTDLVDLIKAAIPAPARREGGHPARRTFQALRIAVNDELGVLERGLEAAVDLLTAGGRLAVITFHSLEDRIVKQAFARWAKGCICPPALPVCRCGLTPKVRLLSKKPITAEVDEVARNPRARSAKLRTAERV
jgi:16S rRNA (cytosine1402-N4)-methyltransferase